MWAGYCMTEQNQPKSLCTVRIQRVYCLPPCSRGEPKWRTPPTGTGLVATLDSIRSTANRDQAFKLQVLPAEAAGA